MVWPACLALSEPAVAKGVCGWAVGTCWGNSGEEGGQPDLAGGESGKKVASQSISFSIDPISIPSQSQSCSSFTLKTSDLEIMWAIPDQGQIQDFGNAELRQYPSTIIFRLGIFVSSLSPKSRRKPCPGFQGFASATDVFSCLLQTLSRILIGPETLPRAWLRKTGLTWGLGHQTYCTSSTPAAHDARMRPTLTVGSLSQQERRSLPSTDIIIGQPMSTCPRALDR